MFIYQCKMLKLFLGIFRRVKRFLEIFYHVFLTQFLTQYCADRPGRSTEPGYGRPGGRPTYTELCTSAGTVDRSTGRSTGPESVALCIWAVDRAVTARSREPCSLYLGGRPGGRPDQRSVLSVSGWSTGRSTGLLQRLDF